MHLGCSASNLVGTAGQERFACSTMEVAKKLQIPGDEQDRQRPWWLASSRLRAIRPGRSRCHFRAPCSRAQTKRIVGELTANDVQDPSTFLYPPWLATPTQWLGAKACVANPRRPGQAISPAYPPIFFAFKHLLNEGSPGSPGCPDSCPVRGPAVACGYACGASVLRDPRKRRKIPRAKNAHTTTSLLLHRSPKPAARSKPPSKAVPLSINAKIYLRKRG